MRLLRVLCFVLLSSLFLQCKKKETTNDLMWPNNEKTAISLSYDDALNSQLDNALPALNKYNFKASFYVTPTNTNAIDKRLNEWRNLALQGHELGNHSIYHPCRASLENRDWVMPYKDLDSYTVEQMREELVTANVLLKAIDGKTKRTFTPPCLDSLANNKPYLPVIKDLFVSIKGFEKDNIAVLWAPSEVSGKELIEYVENASKQKKMINLLFHGIGGDYLTVSKEAHEALLDYLSNNKDKYWVDTYINIMTAAQKNEANN